MYKYGCLATRRRQRRKARAHARAQRLRGQTGGQCGRRRACSPAVTPTTPHLRSPDNKRLPHACCVWGGRALRKQAHTGRLAGRRAGGWARWTGGQGDLAEEVCVDTGPPGARRPPRHPKSKTTGTSITAPTLRRQLSVRRSRKQKLRPRRKQHC